MQQATHDWYQHATFFVGVGTLILVGIYTGIMGYQAWLAKDTARRQLRAYLSVTISGPEGVFAGLVTEVAGMVPPITGKTTMHPFIKNYGQTPAYEVNCWAGIALADFPLRISLPTPPITLTVKRRVPSSRRAKSPP